MIFSDTSQKHCMEQWNGILDCQECAGYGRRGREGQGGNYPAGRGVRCSVTHLCARVCSFQYPKTGGYPV